jgi:hypothetical protein
LKAEKVKNPLSFVAVDKEHHGHDGELVECKYARLPGQTRPKQIRQ